jgi:general secretion pathway protein G
MLYVVRAARRAFTLVELTIVIAILGILAALVVPRLSSATDVARANGAHSQLTTVRKQIEMWKLDHGDQYPTMAQLQQGAADWGALLEKTTTAGEIVATGEWGPYFPAPPINPFTNSSLVVPAGAPVDSAGWTYNPATGFLKLILPATVDPATTDLGALDYERL